MKRKKCININRLNTRGNAAESGGIPDKQSAFEPAVKGIVGNPECDKAVDNSGKKSIGTSVKGRKETLIKRIFSREFNSTTLYMLGEEFTKNMKINAKGRVYLRTLLFFISTIYITDDGLTYQAALTLISVFWLTVPIALNLIAPFAKRMVENRYNLYDILAAIGTYIIASFSLIAGEIVIMKFVIGVSPDLFESLNAVTVTIIFTAVTVFISDMALMFKAGKK